MVGGVFIFVCLWCSVERGDEAAAAPGAAEGGVQQAAEPLRGRGAQVHAGGGVGGRPQRGQLRVAAADDRHHAVRPGDVLRRPHQAPGQGDARTQVCAECALR